MSDNTLGSYETITRRDMAQQQQLSCFACQIHSNVVSLELYPPNTTVPSFSRTGRSRRLTMQSEHDEVYGGRGPKPINWALETTAGYLHTLMICKFNYIELYDLGNDGRPVVFASIWNRSSERSVRVHVSVALHVLNLGSKGLRLRFR